MKTLCSVAFGADNDNTLNEVVDVQTTHHGINGQELSLLSLSSKSLQVNFHLPWGKSS